jgi:GTPase SAR1 family protein
MISFDENVLKAHSRISYFRDAVNSIRDQAEEAPRWRPAQTIKSECYVAIDLIDKMTQRLDRKLVVTLIGPSGAGKSTLLNALSGNDHLSKAGNDRPTTRDVVVFCQSRVDADILLDDLEPHTLSVFPQPTAENMDHVILIDTPDMDSTESEKFHPILEKTIALTDILVCVLNAENPKRRDTIVFLERYVSLFPGSSLYVVLNRCDRLQQNELTDTILPDLRNHLQNSWQRQVDSIFCTSARSHLKEPRWPEGEKPLHAFDQFEKLQDKILGNPSKGGQFVDVRIQRAEHLYALIRESAHQKGASVVEELKEVRKSIIDLENQATLAATATLKETGAEMLTGIQAMFYQNLAGRWWGPIGWLVALWARFLMAGAGVLATLRFGNPLLQIWGLLSSLVRYRKTRSAVEEATTGGDMAPAMLKYRYTIQQAWPDIAARLTRLGFDNQVRNAATVLPEEKNLVERLSSAWKSKLAAVMERRATAVSGFILQLIFNLPTLAVMGLFTYQSVISFLLQNTLPTGYFLHAAVSILMVWLLSFVFFQVIVRFASSRNLLNSAFKELVIDGNLNGQEPLSRSIIGEIDTILSLVD